MKGETGSLIGFRKGKYGFELVKPDGVKRWSTGRWEMVSGYMVFIKEKRVVVIL